MSLSEIIIDTIKKDGPISFHDYMEMALYHPLYGYYTTNYNCIGKSGDYFTSSYVSNIFGALLASQLEEMWNLLGSKEFTILEYGAGEGFLCRDILAQFQTGKLLNSLQYCIIEKSETMRKKERVLLRDRVNWLQGVDEIKNFTGCIISNEMLDNFSVHKVVMQEELMEVFVDYKNGYREVLVPASEKLKSYLDTLQIELPFGFCTEINLEALDWLQQVATSLKSGYVITIDYGHPSSELYRPYRKNGTLTCFYKHKVNEDFFTHIGEQDITSHVNFTALYYWGNKYGLQTCGFTDQARFLESLGFYKYLQKSRIDDTYQSYLEEMSIIQTLQVDMGPKFKVLIQGKNVPQYQLKGLKQSSYQIASC